MMDAPSFSNYVDARQHSSRHIAHDLHHPNGPPAHQHWAQDQTLHVAVAYTNSRRWRTRRELLNDCRRHLESLPNVKLHVGEVAFGDRPFEVTSASHPLDFQWRSREELWLKEAIINLLVARFDPDWRYGAYIDGDFHFTRWDIALETIHQLQHHDWVQMFSTYADLSYDHRPMSCTRSFAERYINGELSHRVLADMAALGYYGKAGGGIGPPGGAWAFRREAFNAVGGLLDVCILGCYDDQTEVLTRRGWTLFADLTLEDQVLSLSPARVAEWQPVTKLHRYHYAGSMRQFKSQSVDLLVTPNHRMLYEKHGSLYFEKAEEFNSSRSVPKAQTWVGVLPRELPIDVSIEDWVAFVGLWLAEGSTYLATDKATGSHHYRIFISQKLGEKYQRIATLLDKFPIKWWANDNGFTGNHKSLFTYLRKLGRLSWEKHIPDDIKNLPANLLEIFLEWYMLGDGNVDKARQENHTDSRRMFTTSPRLRDDLLEVIVKTGHWGAYRVRQPRTSVPLESGRCITARRVGYDIWIHRARMFALKSRHLTDVEYDGEVFCCETPYHTLLVRRNHKMIWCGNSSDWHMAYGLAGHPHEASEHPDVKHCSRGYIEAIQHWQQRATQAIRQNIGVVNCHAIHHFHGSKKRRGYGVRWKILRDNLFDPRTDIYRDWQGIYQLTPDKIKLRDDLRRYFLSRVEDDIGMYPGDEILGD